MSSRTKLWPSVNTPSEKRFLMIIEIKINTIVIMTIHLLIIIRVAMKIIFNLILNLLLLSL